MTIQQSHFDAEIDSIKYLILLSISNHWKTIQHIGFIYSSESYQIFNVRFKFSFC